MEVREFENLMKKDLKEVGVYIKSFQNGSFKDYPYIWLKYGDYDNRNFTVLGPNYRADDVKDPTEHIEKLLNGVQANESFRRRRVNESARRSRTTKKKIR